MNTTGSMIHKKKQVRIKPKHINKNGSRLLVLKNISNMMLLNIHLKTNKTTRYIFRDALAHRKQKPHTRVSTKDCL